MTRLEKLSEHRRWLLVAFGVSFLLWQACSLEIVKHLDGPIEPIASLIALAAVVIWLASLLLLFARFSRRRMDAPTRAVLEDELVRDIRRLAFSTGYAFMLLVSAVLLAASFYTDVTARDAINLVLVTGVVAPVFAFAWLEGRGG